MNPFEVVSWPLLGVGMGFALAVISRWRAIPLMESLIAGGAGGLIGGVIGRSLFTGPLWGELRYSLWAAVFALAGGLVFVVAARVFAPKGQIRPRTP